MTEPTPAVWSDTDPLMTAIAAAVYEQAETTEGGLVMEDPRNIAAVAATVARQVAGTVAAPTTAPPVDTDLRDRITARLWDVAEHTIVAEWICCEPINPEHELCVQGSTALRMVRALLVDDPAAARPAPLLDAVLAVLPAPAEVCICGHTEAQHFEDCCQVCDCGTFLVPEAAREMITHLHAAVLRLKAAAPTDRAAADQPADRRVRYAAAIRAAGVYNLDAHTDAAMAVADTEQAELRAEVAEVIEHRDTILRWNTDTAATAERDESEIDSLRAEVERLRTDRATVPSAVVRQTLRRWAYASGHIESELDGAVGRMYELVAGDVRRRLADEAQQPETETHSEPPVVAYRWYKGGTLLRCLTCAPSPYLIRTGEMVPVTSEDLPDGGICTLTGCGRDVLAAPASSEEPTP